MCRNPLDILTCRGGAVTQVVNVLTALPGSLIKKSTATNEHRFWFSFSPSTVEKPELSKEAIRKICLGEKIEKPVLQIVDFRKLQRDRTQLIVSDGVNSYSSVLLTSEASKKISNNEVNKFSILQLNNYRREEFNGRNVIAILNIEEKAPGT